MAVAQDSGVDTRPLFMVDEASGEMFTSIACYVCRKRKVKCNRLYPTCLNCAQTQQPCTYPRRVSRPGPRIGTVQNTRKRNVDVDPAGQPKKTKTSAPTTTYNTTSQQPITLPPPAPTHAPSLSVQQPLSPSVSTSSTSASHLSRDITSLSFILHPSLEPREAEPHVEVDRDLDGRTDNDSIMISACSALGVDVTELHQL